VCSYNDSRPETDHSDAGQEGNWRFERTVGTRNTTDTLIIFTSFNKYNITYLLNYLIT